MTYPPVHWFTANNGKTYLYETATNRIFSAELPFGADKEECVRAWREEGVLCAAPMPERRFSHSIEDYFQIIEHALPRLTLETTCQCNCRCSYCVYSGSFDGRRSHSQADMAWETMEKGIRFYLDHSDRALKEEISFFGGEALIRFDLIRKAVSLVETLAPQRHMHYTISSNGLLLRGEVVRWLAEHPEAGVTVTLNGPDHDQYRRKADGSGTLHAIMDNLKAIRRDYPDVWANQVKLLCNYTSHEELLRQRDFFEQELGQMPVLITPVIAPKAPGGAAKLFAQAALRFEDVQRIYEEAPSAFLDRFFRLNFLRIHERWIGSEAYPSEINSCMPLADGVFVGVDGKFQICTEMSCAPDIGNLDDGYDYQALKTLYHAAEAVHRGTGCKDCWAQRLCELCYKDFMTVDGPLERMQIGYCEHVRRSIHSDLAQYCAVAHDQARLARLVDDEYSEDANPSRDPV